MTKEALDRLVFETDTDWAECIKQPLPELPPKRPTDWQKRRLERIKEIKADHKTVKAALEELESIKDNLISKRASIQPNWFIREIQEENQELKAEIARLNALLDEDRLTEIYSKYFCNYCDELSECNKSCSIEVIEEIRGE